MVVSRLIQFALALVVAVPLASSSIVHITNPFFFYEAILLYDILPSHFGVGMAILFPFLGLILSVALFFESLRASAGMIMTSMLVVFLVAQVQAIVRGLSIDCGCFGATSHDVSISSCAMTGALCLASMTLTCLCLRGTKLCSAAGASPSKNESVVYKFAER